MVYRHRPMFHFRRHEKTFQNRPELPSAAPPSDCAARHMPRDVHHNRVCLNAYHVHKHQFFLLLVVLRKISTDQHTIFIENASCCGPPPAACLFTPPSHVKTANQAGPKAMVSGSGLVPGRALDTNKRAVMVRKLHVGEVILAKTPDGDAENKNWFAATVVEALSGGVFRCEMSKMLRV